MKKYAERKKDLCEVYKSATFKNFENQADRTHQLNIIHGRKPPPKPLSKTPNPMLIK